MGESVLIDPSPLFWYWTSTILKSFFFLKWHCIWYESLKYSWPLNKIPAPCYLFWILGFSLAWDWIKSSLPSPPLVCQVLRESSSGYFIWFVELNFVIFVLQWFCVFIFTRYLMRKYSTHNIKMENEYCILKINELVIETTWSSSYSST